MAAEAEGAAEAQDIFPEALEVAGAVEVVEARDIYQAVPEAPEAAEAAEAAEVAEVAEVAEGTCPWVVDNTLPRTSRE